MIVRPAGKEDSRAVAAYIAMAESEVIEFFAGSKDREVILDVLETFLLSPEPNRYSLSANTVAEVDGAAVGSIIAFAADQQAELDRPVLALLRERGLDISELTPEGAPGTWYLSTMGVNPEYRGRGIGAALIQAAAMAGRAQGFETLSLLVSREKPRAKALYERLGFRAGDVVRIAAAQYERMLLDIDSGYWGQTARD